MNVSILLVCYKLEYYSWDLGVLGIGSIVNMNVFLTSQEVAVNAESSTSSSRVRLEEFKTRAKRSLTESLEGIWKVCKHFLHFEHFCPHYIFCTSTIQRNSPCVCITICSAGLNYDMIRFIYLHIIYGRFYVSM